MYYASPRGHIDEYPLWCLCSHKQRSEATIFYHFVFIFECVILSTPCMAAKCNHRDVTFRRIPNIFHCMACVVFFIHLFGLNLWFFDKLYVIKRRMIEKMFITIMI